MSELIKGGTQSKKLSFAKLSFADEYCSDAFMCLCDGSESCPLPSCPYYDHEFATLLNVAHESTSFANKMYSGHEPLLEDVKTVGSTLSEQRGIKNRKAQIRRDHHASQMSKWRSRSKERAITRRKVVFDFSSSSEEEEPLHEKRRRRENVRARLRAECAEMRKAMQRKRDYCFQRKKERQLMRRLDVICQVDTVVCDGSCDEEKRNPNCYCDLFPKQEGVFEGVRMEDSILSPPPKAEYEFKSIPDPWDVTKDVNPGRPDQHVMDTVDEGRAKWNIPLQGKPSVWKLSAARKKKIVADIKENIVLIESDEELKTSNGDTAFARVSSILNQWKEKILALCKNVNFPQGGIIFDTIHDCVCFIYTLMKSPDSISVYCTTTLFIRRFNLSSSLTAIVSALMSCIHKMFGIHSLRDVHPQALSDDIADLGSNLGATFDAPLVSSIRNLIVLAASGVLGFHAFSKSTAFKIFEILGPAVKCGLIDAIQLALSCLSKIIKSFEMWNAGASLSEAMFSDDPCAAAVSDIAFCMRNENNTYTGIPVAGAHSRQEYITKLNGAIQILEVSKTKLSSRAFKSSPYFKAYYDGLNLLVRMRRLTAGTFRETPLCFVIAGPPGVGKSKMVNLIATAGCAARGVKFHSGMQYTRCAASQYWDNYDPQSQKVIFYSEMGAYKKEYVAKSGDDLLKEFLSLVDSLPYPVNMSKTEDKGLFYADPWMVIVDTNNESLGIDALFHAPGALKRRMIIVRPTVLPEFAGADGVTLDTSKSLASKRGFMDKWTFQVVQHLPVGNDGINSTTTVHLNNASTGDFVDWLTSYSHDEVIKQEKIAKMTNKGDVFLGYGKLQRLAQSWIAKGVSPDDVFEGYIDKREGAMVRSIMLTIIDLKPIQEKLDKQPLRTEKLWSSTKKHFNSLLRGSQKSAEDAARWFDLNVMLKIDRKFSKSVEGGFDLDTLFGSDEYTEWKAKPLENDFEVMIRKLSKKFSDAEATFLVECAIVATKTKEYYNGIRDIFNKDELIELHDFELDVESHIFTPESSCNDDDSDEEQIELLAKPQVESSSDLLRQWGTCAFDKAFDWYEQYQVTMPVVQAYVDLHLKSVWDYFITPLMVKFNMEGNFTVSVLRLLIFNLTIVALAFGWWKWLAIVYMLIMPFINYGRILMNTARRDIEETVVTRTRAFVSFYANAIVDSEWTRNAGIVLQIAGLIAIVGTTATVFCSDKKKKIPADEQVSSFQVPSEYNEKINAIEEKMDIKFGTKVIQNKIQNHWNVQTVLNSATHTGDCISLQRVCRNNLRKVCITINGEIRRQHLFGVQGNYALINKHAVHGASQFMLGISPTGNFENDVQQDKCVVSLSECVQVAPDLLLVPTNQNFRDIVTHICVAEDLSRTSCGAMIGADKIHAEFVFSEKYVESAYGRISFNRFMQYKWAGEDYGQCGLFVVSEHGNSSWISGIHAFGKAGVGYAMIIDRDTIQHALDSLKARNASNLIISSQCYKLPELESVSKRSPFRHEILQGITCLGKLPGEVHANKKSRLMVSPLYQRGKVDEIFFNHFNYVSSQKYGPPLMSFRRDGNNYISPINLALKKMSTSKIPLSKRVLEICVQRFVDHTIEHLLLNGIEKGSITPYSVEDAINGVLNDPNFRRIDPSKSAGFGTPGKKYKYIPLVTSDSRDVYREPVENLKAEIFDVLDSYAKRQNSGIVFTSQLKDEARPVEKIASGKTRVFAMTPFASLVISRMLLGPIFSLMMTQQEAFCTSIGTDMHRDAHELYEMMRTFIRNGFVKDARECEIALEKLIMEGDYSNYDQSMPFDLRYAAFSYIKRLALWMGYNDLSIVLLEGLCTDLLFPMLCVQLELMVIPAYGPSGMYGTAEFNSVCGVLLFLYAWYFHLELNQFDFFKMNKLRVYGDDMINGVSESVCHLFNAEYYSKFCIEHYGMPFTSTSKTDKIIPLVSLSEMSFLKRTFHFSNIFKRVVAPLDMSSLMKTLSWTMPSSTVSVYEQTVQSINSVLLEIMFHTDDVDNLKLFRDSLVELAISSFDKCDPEIVEKEIFTIHRCIQILSLDNVCETSLEVRPVTSGRQDVEPQCFRERMCNSPFQIKEQQNTGIGFDLPVSSEWNHNPQQRSSVSFLRKQALLIRGFLEELKVVANPCPGSTIEELINCPLYSTNLMFSISVTNYANYLAQKANFEHTIEYLEIAISRRSNLLNVDAQMEVFGASSGNVVNKDQNVTDYFGMQEDQRSYGKSRVTPMLSQESLDLNDFFKRPILIGNGILQQNSDVDIFLNPWNLYMADQSVRSKFRNYGFLRADMVVRIFISGTPFNMGRMQVSAFPWADYNPFYVKFRANLADPTVRDMWRVYASTTKDVRYMDVADNKPLEITLPYVSPKPVARLFNQDGLVLGASSNFDDLDGMYIVNFQTINQVESVSADATEVSYQIFAFLDNVTWSVTTGTKLSVDVQSEFESGPIEKMVTSALAVSQAMENVPIIGVQAKASSSALSVAKDVSHLLGMSRPTLKSDPIRMKNEAYQNAASTLGGEVGHKLTLDPKQEITVDSDDGAVQEDEMSIASFNKKYGLLFTFDWLTTNNITEPIFSVNVNPMAHFPFTYLSTTMTQFFPMGYAAQFFEFWRGDITYKFDIVSSKFHRGRIAVVYDPNAYQQTLIKAAPRLNQSRVVVVDLQETRSFEITVEWAHHRQWARLPDTVDAGNMTNEDNIASSNGFIYVYPLTKLQAPLSKSVHINVFVKSDNMCYNFFNNTNGNKQIKWPTEVLAFEEKDGFLDVDAQCDPEWHETITPPTLTPSDLCVRYFGEAPVSFRSLLKRYMKPFEEGANFSTSSYAALTAGIYPRMVSTPDVTAGTTEAEMFYRWMKYCFLGMKGGWKYRFYTSYEFALSGRMVRVGNLSPSFTTISPSVAAYASVPSLSTGSSTFITTTNDGVEVEFPFYSNNSFLFAMGEEIAPDIPIFETKVLRNFIVYMQLDTHEITPRYFRIQPECCPADDFTFLRYVAIPPFTN